MKHQIGTVLLGLTSFLLAFVRLPDSILTFCAAIVGGVWLLINGELGIALAGVGALTVGEVIITTAALPVALGAVGVVYNNPKSRSLHYVAQGIIGLSYFLVSILWSVGVAYAFFHKGNSHPAMLWPMLLFAYAIAVSPWNRLAKQELWNFNFASFLLSYKGACMVLLVLSAFIKLSILELVVLVGGGMLFFLLVSAASVFAAKLCGKDLRKAFIKREVRRQREASVGSGNTFSIQIGQFKLTNGKRGKRDFEPRRTSIRPYKVYMDGPPPRTGAVSAIK